MGKGCVAKGGWHPHLQSSGHGLGGGGRCLGPSPLFLLHPPYPCGTLHFSYPAPLPQGPTNLRKVWNSSCLLEENATCVPDWDFGAPEGSPCTETHL